MILLDLIIRNGMVIDGTGAPRKEADVLISDGEVPVRFSQFPGVAASVQSSPLAVFEQVVRKNVLQGPMPYRTYSTDPPSPDPAYPPTYRLFLMFFI